MDVDPPVGSTSNENAHPTKGGSRYIHSDIYDRLVRDENDLSGLVAYGLYQAEKRQWISDFESSFGSTPSEEKVKAFCFTSNEDRLSKLRVESQVLIFKVAEETVAARTEQMVANAFNLRAVQELGKVQEAIDGMNLKTTADLGKIHTAIGEVSKYRHHVVGWVRGLSSTRTLNCTVIPEAVTIGP